MGKHQLREWRKSTEFSCPQCSMPVHLKVGDIVIPHFAHQQEASCSTMFSEGESQEHLEGKRQLYEFFLTKVDDVALEPYFKLLEQRPDLLITTRSNQVPIEFQCSTIPLQLIESRTKGYLSAGMKPIWILHTPAQFSTLPQGVGVYNLSRFHESFFTYESPEGTVFLTYNPQTEKFHYFSSLIHIAGRQYVGIHRILPISMQTFPFARPKAPTAEELRLYVSVYLSSRMNFLKSSVLLNRRGINDPFLKNCYDLRILPIELPLWIGLPVPKSNAFRQHNCEWQMRLVHYMMRNGLSFPDLSNGLIRKFLSWQDGLTEDHVNACMSYRDMLLSMGIQSPDRTASFDEEKIIPLFAERFLAKWKEN